MLRVKTREEKILQIGKDENHLTDVAMTRRIVIEGTRQTEIVENHLKDGDAILQTAVENSLPTEGERIHQIVIEKIQQIVTDTTTAIQDVAHEHLKNDETIDIAREVTKNDVTCRRGSDLALDHRVEIVETHQAELVTEKRIPSTEIRRHRRRN